MRGASVSLLSFEADGRSSKYPGLGDPCLEPHNNPCLQKAKSMAILYFHEMKNKWYAMFLVDCHTLLSILEVFFSFFYKFLVWSTGLLVILKLGVLGFKIITLADVVLDFSSSGLRFTFG